MKKTQSHPLELVMLDCDGVLFDSIRSNVAYYHAILETMGDPPLDKEARRLCHVYSTPQLFAHLYADDPEKVRDAVRIAYTIDYLPFLEYMDPEPGLYEVLRRLKASYKVALATNRGKSIPALLERFELEGVFDMVSTILDVESPKPAPDMLHEAAKRLQYATHELLFVGDSELDQAAARMAEMPFAIYRGDLQADVRLEHHGELVALFAKEGERTT